MKVAAPTVDWEKWKFLVETREGWAICAVSVAFFFCCCGYTWNRLCRKKDKIVASEQFKWPSSKRFLKYASVARPPPLVVNKFADPLRTDKLPFGEERHWTLIYQPNGDRAEVQQPMYLNMRDNRIFGVGYEKIRKVCKAHEYKYVLSPQEPPSVELVDDDIWCEVRSFQSCVKRRRVRIDGRTCKIHKEIESHIEGKYRHDAAANQTVVVMNCMFSNELDLVMLHGTGNGTAFVGNCYIHEIDPFSTAAGIPWVRSGFGCKFKGSFILTMNNNMGGHNLRMVLHSRGVVKFAGELFPDETASPNDFPPEHAPDEDGLHFGSEALDDDDDDEGSHGVGIVSKALTPTSLTSGRRRSSTSAPRTPTSTSTSGRRRSSTSAPRTPTSGPRSFLSKIFRDRRWGGWRQGGMGYDAPATSASEDQDPPWVKKEQEADQRDSGRRGSLSPTLSPGGRYYAEGGRQQRRKSGTPGRRPSNTLKANTAINHLNYLEMDEIPGRSGPSMV